MTGNASSGIDREPIHCTECGKKIGTANSENAKVYETGEVAHETRLNASVQSPMASMVVLLDFECRDCTQEPGTGQSKNQANTDNSK